MYEWGDIRIFLAVAEEGSTLAAAKVLAINQTTVSRRIQVLEQALGLQLFERDTRGFQLTAMGRAMVDVATQMRRSAEDVQTRASNLARNRGGRIRVTAAGSTLEHWVIPVTNAYRKKNPEVQFEIDHSGRQVDLTKGEADIAFRVADEVTGDTLVARKLGMVPWAAYCSKPYVRDHGLPRSFEELEDHKVLFYTKNMATRVSTLRYFAERIRPEQVSETYNSIASIAGSLCISDAVGPLPMVEGEARPELVFCFTSKDWAMPLWLVTSREGYESPVIRDFMKFTADYGLKDGLTLI